MSFNHPKVIVFLILFAVLISSSLYKWDKNNFQPRFAVAWSPNFGKTKRNLFDWLFGANNESVIRGGFAVTNDHLAPLLIIRYGNAQGSAGFTSSPQVRNVYNLTEIPIPLGSFQSRQHAKNGKHSQRGLHSRTRPAKRRATTDQFCKLFLDSRFAAKYAVCPALFILNNVQSYALRCDSAALMMAEAVTLNGRPAFLKQLLFFAFKDAIRQNGEARWLEAIPLNYNVSVNHYADKQSIRKI